MKPISIILSLIACSLFFACSKDSFTTKPQLKIKKINTNRLLFGQELKIEVEFTDAEGDVQDTIWYKRVSKVCPSESAVRAEDKLKIPNFESIKDQKGVFEFSFIYGKIQTGSIFLNPCATKNDTSYFKFWMKDKANNYSDTITTENIAFIK